MGAYQLKITIKGSKPPIWRRILVPEGITFEGLHQVIQTAFSWSGEHLYQFEFRSEGVAVVPFGENKSKKLTSISAKESIDSLVSAAAKFTYTYNFKDSWEFVIQVEDTITDYQESYAQVVKFKGDIIPEYCESLSAYNELLENPQESIKEYDLEAVNRDLKPGGESSLEEINITDIYHHYDNKGIAEIAERHGMSGLDALDKEELAKQTIAHILNKEVMRKYFLCVRDSEMELFEQLLTDDSQIMNDDIEELDFLYAGGYLTAGSDSRFVVSKDVKEAYRVINTTEFQQERSRIGKIGDYLCAANSLYAITPPSVLLETFNKYESPKLTQEELMQAYEQLLPYRCLVIWMEGCFVDAALAEQRSYANLVRVQKKVPYYIPTLQEIRFMADNDGFLMTPELDKLTPFLKEEMSVSEDLIPYILRQVQAEISLGGELQDVLTDLEVLGITIHEGEEMERFVLIMNEIWNHTRLVLNRGHKPYEMVMKGLEDVSTQRKTGQKIYPNDTCPCGSGKKYKKCCASKA
jgi:hypothetical protein